MDTVGLRHAVRADLTTIVDVWLDAFVGDPYLRWIASDDEVYAAFGTEWLTFIATLAFERGHTYLGAGQQMAVAWIPPDLSLVAPNDVEHARTIVATHAGDARADQALATIIEARGHSLEEPHWTLQYIGVRNTAQGRGLGAVAVAPRLESCDADGLACGLVSTNPRNVMFYERLGFRVVAEVPTPDGRVVLRPMHRPARPS